jgi:lysophospholipase L1-like esterase
MWIPLGARLLKENVYQTVTFTTIGVAGSRVQDWADGGVNYSKLLAALSSLRRQQISPSYVLWLQGSANAGDTRHDYKNQFVKIEAALRDNGIFAPIIVAIHSRCGDMHDETIAEAQIALGIQTSRKLFRGPNTDDLGSEYRMRDRCHLNRLGQQTMADRWFDSIKATTEQYNLMRRETLIELFSQIERTYTVPARLENYSA